MRLVGIIRLAVFTAWLVPASAQAAPILDQSFEGPFVTGVHCVGDSCLTGQEFTVGITGTLTSGELYFTDWNDSLRVGLYDVDLFAPTLLQESLTRPVFTGQGFYSFAFNLPVTEGQRLGLLVLGAGSRLAAAWATTVDPYPGGAGFHAPDLDFGFRTYVEPAPPVPEPASILLLGTGVVLAARRFRQSRG